MCDNRQWFTFTQFTFYVYIITATLVVVVVVAGRQAGKKYKYYYHFVCYLFLLQNLAYFSGFWRKGETFQFELLVCKFCIHCFCLMFQNIGQSRGKSFSAVVQQIVIFIFHLEVCRRCLNFYFILFYQLLNGFL